MNRFYVIGLDDNMRQYFPPEIDRTFALARESGLDRYKSPVGRGLRSLSFVRRSGKYRCIRFRRSFVFRIRRYDSKPIAGCANPPVPVI